MLEQKHFPRLQVVLFQWMNMHKWQCKLSFAFTRHVWMIVHGKHIVWILKFQEIVFFHLFKRFISNLNLILRGHEWKKCTGRCLFLVIWALLFLHCNIYIKFLLPHQNHLCYRKKMTDIALLSSFLFRKGLLKNHFVHNLIFFLWCFAYSIRKNTTMTQNGQEYTAYK